MMTTNVAGEPSVNQAAYCVDKPREHPAFMVNDRQPVY